MQSGSTDHAAERRFREEEYYRWLWSSEAWSGAEPNDSDGLRAEKITGFIEKFILPQSRQAPLKILDLGCGRGWLTNLLTKYGQVVGVDPIAAGIDRARQIFPNLDLRTINSFDAFSTFGKAYFDLVISSEVIKLGKCGQQRSAL